MTVDDCSSGASGDCGRPDALVHLDWRQFGEPSSGIVEAVARATDQHATELPPLHDAVETDALNVLLKHDGQNRSTPILATFRYVGFQVSTSSDGDVVVQTETR